MDGPQHLLDRIIICSFPRSIWKYYACNASILSIKFLERKTFRRFCQVYYVSIFTLGILLCFITPLGQELPKTLPMGVVHVMNESCFHRTSLYVYRYQFHTCSFAARVRLSVTSNLYAFNLYVRFLVILAPRPTKHCFMLSFYSTFTFLLISAHFSFASIGKITSPYRTVEAPATVQCTISTTERLARCSLSSAPSGRLFCCQFPFWIPSFLICLVQNLHTLPYYNFFSFADILVPFLE